MGEVYNKALKFKRIHRGGVVWNLRSHCEDVEKHLNPGEEVIAAFAGQKNEKFYEIYKQQIDNINYYCIICEHNDEKMKQKFLKLRYHT